MPRPRGTEKGRTTSGPYGAGGCEGCEVFSLACRASTSLRRTRFSSSALLTRSSRSARYCALRAR